MLHRLMQSFHRFHPDDAVPVLLRADSLVVHGSLAGCVAAFRLAEEGRDVVVVSGACSIPHEAVICRRPWIREEDLAELPAAFGRAYRLSVAHSLEDGEMLVTLSQLAIRVEDVLLDAGVRIFYGMNPCGTVKDTDDRLAGVVFGGKFGLNAIAAEHIVDATPTALVAALAGARLRPCRPGAETIDVTMSAKVNVMDLPEPGPDEIDHRTAAEKQRIPTTWPEQPSLEVPGIRELIDGRIVLHGPYAEIRLRVPAPEDGPARYATLSNDVRRILLEIGRGLNERRREQGDRPLLVHRFSGSLLTEPLVTVTGDMPENLHMAGVHVPGDEIEHPTSKLRSASLPSMFDVRCSMFDVRPPSLPALTLRCSDAPPLHTTGETLPLEDTTLPVLAECDVLVAGGGTSGVPAALAAAESGAQTILVEQQDDVGGTHTVGGVGNYWFGRETPFHRVYNGACNALVHETGVAVEVAMRKVLRDAGVTVLTGCATVGVLMDGNRAAGVVVATEQGPGIVLGKITVDATGDADLAAWAGAPCDYGNDRDAWTYWASFANFNEVRRTASRQYESSIEVRDPYDFTRIVVTGRRRQGMWKSHAHEMPQFYAAPRESRHLRGEATVTYGGILAGETCPDLVTVCESNFDIKGIASSDLINSGIVWSWNTHRTYRAAIPYRALLPQGVDDLLVVGKAYSATHDAMALARMQRDMGCLGASGGIAAAEAARSGTSLRDLDIPALQEQWVDRGTLFPEDLRRSAKTPPPYSAEDAERDSASLGKSHSRAPERLARLARSEDAVAPLRKAFANAEGQALKVKIARTLCLLGDANTVPFLLDTVEGQITGRLPRPRTKTIAIPPEHGWAGDPVYSLYAIGLTERGAEAAPLLEQVAAMIEDDPELFDSRTDSPFEYVRMICAVAERNPGPAMLPALEALLSKACLRDRTVPYHADARMVLDPILERCAYLELCLGRALARCADRRGYDILLRYVDDLRGCLARSAVDELQDLLGDTKNENRPAWEARIEQRVASGAPKPYGKRVY